MSMGDKWMLVTMERYMIQRVRIVKHYNQNCGNSISTIREAPSGSVADIKFTTRAHTGCSEANIAAVRESITEREYRVLDSVIVYENCFSSHSWSFFNKDLHFHVYSMTLTQKLVATDHVWKSYLIGSVKNKN